MNLQKVMENLTENGWNRYDKNAGNNVTDEEVKKLFEMIDRDKSGTLTLRVGFLMFVTFK